MTGFWQDIRYSFRRLRRAPGFSCAVVAILAIGIGSTSAMFSVIDALLLRPLPYKDADRLVWVNVNNNSVGLTAVPGPHFLEWEKSSRSLSTLAAFNSGNPTLTGIGEAERLQSNSVSLGFFSTFDAPLLVGRRFVNSDYSQSTTRAAILSEALWKRKFNGDPAVIGKVFKVTGQVSATDTVDGAVTIVGVLRGDFRFIQAADIWLPLILPEQGLDKGISGVSLIARLAPGISVAQAESELKTLAEPMASRYGFLASGQVQVLPLRDKLVGGADRLSLILWAATGLVLMISCANAANLLLSRTVARRKPVAVRMALGATRIRVLRESLVESLLLAVGGGGLGAVLALGMTRAIGAYAPADLFGRITQIDSIRLNSTVLLFTIGLSILTGLLFGGIPGIQVTRLNIESVLRDASRTISQRTRLQHLLMAVEIAVSVLLTVAAGLLLRGFIHVVEIPSGYNAANLLTFTIDSPVGSPSANRIAPGASDATARIQFFQTLLDRISGIPEVQTAATSTYLPLTRLGLRVLLRVDGAPPEPIPQGMTPISAISPGYFRTMNIPLKQGRSFETTDDSRAPLVVIVSEAVARHFFGADNPIGRTVSLPGWTPEASSQSGSVVGVVADVRAAGPDQPIAPQIYIPYAQGPVWGTNTIIVRSRSSRKDLAATVREVVRSLDVDRPVYDVQTMDQRLDGVLSGRRFNLLLFGAFAVGAGLLAVAGVYSVITYIVSQRTHEIGIRMSLGAAKTDILSLFIREGLSWVIGGLVVGIALSISLTRAMSSLLFDISPTDFLTYSSVTSLILVVAAVACYIPARASAQVDPSIALREE